MYVIRPQFFIPDDLAFCATPRWARTAVQERRSRAGASTRTSTSRTSRRAQWRSSRTKFSAQLPAWPADQLRQRRSRRSTRPSTTCRRRRMNLAGLRAQPAPGERQGTKTLTIKKLTRKNPTMQAKFAELAEQRAAGAMIGDGSDSAEVLESDIDAKGDE